ncbi:Mth938-like domain-containing protein [Ancylobacter sp. 6x-1]|uniref:Mth938-like domain-containing protein n=1 Tax=Ancylobacter crimeensis TaxID=2579147 RepID=A0ABT0D6I9_9HYPH|nr:Mth938-like domain-containing protein [Ancylobacter crimeensis]MCK0195564.1 Mth938-like domain-containing protein [Ancylobacter crimeensis]
MAGFPDRSRPPGAGPSGARSPDTRAPDAPGHLPQQVPIEGYGGGFFHFAGMASSGSILALPSGIHEWAARLPVDITEAALAQVFADARRLELVLIGTGPDPWPIPEALRWRFRDAGVRVDAMPTRSAAATYNVLLAEGRAVGAALLALA